MVGIGNLVKMNKLRAIATKYAFGDVLLPCTHNVKSLPAFKKGLRKAARFLRKGKRTGLRKAARFLRKGKRTGKGN